MHIDTSYLTKTLTTTISYIWQQKDGGVPLLSLINLGTSDDYSVSAIHGTGVPSNIKETNQEEEISIYHNPTSGI